MGFNVRFARVYHMARFTAHRLSAALSTQAMTNSGLWFNLLKTMYAVPMMYYITYKGIFDRAQLFYYLLYDF